MNNYIQQFINAAKLMLQNKTEEGETTIMNMRKYQKDFLEITLAICSDQNIQTDIYTRQLASIEFKNLIDKNLKHLDNQFFIQLILAIIPAGANAAQFNVIAILNNLSFAFEKMFEHLKYFFVQYKVNIADIASQVFNQICVSVNMNSLLQTEYSLKLFTSFARIFVQEQHSELRDAALVHFYSSFQIGLLNFFINDISDINSFNVPRLVNVLTQSLKCLFDPRQVDQVFQRPETATLPVYVTQLFQKLHSTQNNMHYQNAKDDCCNIILKYIQKNRKLMQNQFSLETNEQFLQLWQTNQVPIATTILQDLLQCSNFDLFADYEAINSVFYLGCELIQKNNVNNQFYHPIAAEIILQSSKDLVQQIFQMIINAANIRMARFKTDDLLVIDCLKPSVDLVHNICVHDQQIEEELIQQAAASLNEFLSNNMVKSPENDAKIFVGTLLIRRALPRIQSQIKYQVCLRGLQHCQFIHEIVFEEIAKLIIQVTYDEYNKQNFVYTNNCSFNQALELASNMEQENDLVPYILDLMVQLYCSDQPGIFQYRMLSGILSRPVRSDMFPVEVSVQLLTKSLLIMLNNDGQTQSGGMVTLTKTILSIISNEMVDEIVTDLILNHPNFNKLPEILQQSYNNNQLQQTMLIVENAFNILNMIIELQQQVSNQFEIAVVQLCNNILQVNFDLASSVFEVLNYLSQKNVKIFNETNQNVELFDVCLQGFCQCPENKEMYTCMQHALCYIKFVMPRHLNQIAITNNVNNSSLIVLIDNLIQRQSLVSSSFACYLMSQLLDCAATNYKQILNLVLEKFFAHFENLLQRNFQELCSPTQTQFIEPETKRMCLFFISNFFFTICGVCEATETLVPKVQQIIQSTNGATNAIACVFAATWSLQDHKYNMGTTWRYNLALYVCASFGTLSQTLGANIAVVWPALLWGRYTIISQRDCSQPEPPNIQFDLLQSTQADQQVLQVVFDNLFSKALQHAQASNNLDCPFWNRNEASLFGEALKTIGCNYEEMSRFGKSVGSDFMVNRITQAMRLLDMTQFPQQYQEYFTNVINQFGQLPNMNIWNE